jgi:phosphoribosyl 1,2-cyclic phosphodiesterase
MENRSAVLTFRGVRGSMPVSGPTTEKYGGHTLCIDIDPVPGLRVIIDGGTGISALAEDLTVPESGIDFHVFLTHYHWDHLQGILFFPPLYDERNRFTFYGHAWDGMGVREAVEGALRPPWFPVSIFETAAGKEYVDVEHSPFEVGPLSIEAAPLHHPQGVTAYRITHGTNTVVLATDCERGNPVADETLRDLAAGADYLIHDAQYTPDEYPTHYLGWGHSTRHHAVEAALEAKAKSLVLVSHDPRRSDDQIDAIVEAAQEEFPATRAAYEGMQISF